MTIEEAIKTAIALEERVRDSYQEAFDSTEKQVLKRFLKVLVEEEQEHVDYLRAKLAQWTRTEKIDGELVKTVLPSKEVLDAHQGEFDEALSGVADATEIEMLSQALDVERNTSAFYRDLIEKLPELGRMLFARFAEIEEGHLALVQAQIDHAQNLGTWFDIQEFVI